MQGISARSMHWTLDDAAGTPQNLSQYVKSIDMTDDTGMEDSTTASSTNVTKQATLTLKEGGFTVKGPFAAALNTHLKGVKMGLTAGNGTLSFVIGLQGSTAGQERTTGECRMKSLKRTGEVDGILLWEAEFVYDGNTTEDTF